MGGASQAARDMIGWFRSEQIHGAEWPSQSPDIISVNLQTELPLSRFEVTLVRQGEALHVFSVSDDGRILVLPLAHDLISKPSAAATPRSVEAEV